MKHSTTITFALALLVSSWAWAQKSAPISIPPLEKWENDGIHVKVTGVMATVTVCSDRELKTEVIGCRWIDTSKPITVEKQ